MNGKHRSLSCGDIPAAPQNRLLQYVTVIEQASIKFNALRRAATRSGQKDLKRTGQTNAEAGRKRNGMMLACLQG